MPQRKPHRAPRHAAGRIANHRDARLPCYLQPRHADHAEREPCFALPIHARRKGRRAIGARVRSIAYDAAGNITSDSRLGSVYAYTYNKANRLKTVSYEGNQVLFGAADSRRAIR